MNKTVRIILKPKKEESLLRFHPWVFSGAIRNIEGTPEEGDVVDVFASGGAFLGRGHYQPNSIAVRILTFDDRSVDESFWLERLHLAYDMRKALNLPLGNENNTYRLVHGEGDFLPGLIIDIYAGVAVMQAHSVGMHYARFVVAEMLKSILPDEVKAVYYKSETTLPFKAGVNAEDGYIWGHAGDVIATENGLNFYVDFVKGQKTGFFVDQRENRILLEKYAKGRSALNMFSYTGGFSFYAMRGGAALVHSVDSSAKAVSIAEKNVSLNFPDDNRHRAYAEDAFKFLERTEYGTYDLVVLDPPAFAKHRDVLRNALIGYRKLNTVAFEKIRPGGILFTFSCSQAVSRENFRMAVFSAAAQSRRKVRILHQLTQPADHPVNIYHPEGEYLKGLVLFIE